MPPGLQKNSTGKPQFARIIVCTLFADQRQLK